MQESAKKGVAVTGSMSPSPPLLTGRLAWVQAEGWMVERRVRWSAEQKRVEHLWAKGMVRCRGRAWRM